MTLAISVSPKTIVNTTGNEACFPGEACSWMDVLAAFWELSQSKPCGQLSSSSSVGRGIGDMFSVGAVSPCSNKRQMAPLG